jgi:D-alanyl-D-alanine carboxypeptidase
MTPMLRRLTLLALLLVAACDSPYVPPPPVLPPADTLPPPVALPRAAALDSLLAADGPTRGLGIAAAVAWGTGAWSGASGSVAPGGAAMQPEAVFQVGSVTKQFTSAAILLLVEAGLMDLEDPLTLHLPDAPVQGRVVRIRHLLEHTSGLPEYTDIVNDPWAPLTRAQIVDSIASRPFLSEPGEKYSYKNSGYYLLGLAIEQVAGRTYGDFLREEILEPLGLTSTGLCGEPPIADVPGGWMLVGPNMHSVPPIHMEVPLSAGALCSTAGDLVRWARALGRGEVVSPASYARMTTPGTLNNGQSTPYGLGLLLVARAGRTAHSHNGAIPGFMAQLAYYPSQDVAVAVLINQMPTDPGALEQRLAGLTFGRAP